MIYSSLTASGIRLVRPFNLQSHAALQQLATAFDACIRRGVLLLAGRPRAALLAVNRRGDIIAAVLLDAAEGDSDSSPHPCSSPHSACTDAAVACAPDAQGVTPNVQR